MSDIFISYSSKDREQAEQLIELLASAGLSVWIDRSGIEVSTSWSKEIVQAINECKAFVVLLSPNSLISNNVIKEVSLASEKRKKILPLDLEPVQLTEDFEYQLVGIQRAPMTNIDAVIRALAKLGLAATQAPSIKLVKETDARKSLMILPFQDLSPTADNAWFADGIVSELIQALSNVKSLHVTDAQTTKDFKRYQGTLPTYAKEMSIRYFVEGDVRKFGDQIKVNSRLLDIETGDHLWQDSMKGVMDDIFEIQEAVALKVVEGLKVHLASDEKKKLAERGTENAEAYELALKAFEYEIKNTFEDTRIANRLLMEAIELDPNYARAYGRVAYNLTSIYRLYERSQSLLLEAEALATKAHDLEPDWPGIYSTLSVIHLQQGHLAEAEADAKRFVEIRSDSYESHFSLGFFYMETQQPHLSIPCFEQSLSLKPDYFSAHFNLVMMLTETGPLERRIQAAERAIPYWEQRNRRFPDIEQSHVRYVSLLIGANKESEARTYINFLTGALPQLVRDGYWLFSLSGVAATLGEHDDAMKLLIRSFKAGYADLDLIRTEPRLDGLRDREDFMQLIGELEVKSNV